RRVRGQRRPYARALPACARRPGARSRSTLPRLVSRRAVPATLDQHPLTSARRRVRGQRRPYARALPACARRPGARSGSPPSARVAGRSPQRPGLLSRSIRRPGHLPHADRPRALVALGEQPRARPAHARRIVAMWDVDLGHRALAPAGKPDPARIWIELAAVKLGAAVAAVVAPVVHHVAERVADLAD